MVKWPDGLKELWLGSTKVTGTCAFHQRFFAVLSLLRSRRTDFSLTSNFSSLPRVLFVAGDVSAVKWPEGLQTLNLAVTKVSGTCAFHRRFFAVLSLLRSRRTEFSLASNFSSAVPMFYALQAIFRR